MTQMGKSRLEAFSDGVLAIVITIMVLEMKAPEGAELTALVPLLPVFLSYVLSFVYVGIYWNNHHHMLHTVRGVTGGILWANLYLLFWLTLIPFTTAWMGESHAAVAPTVAYGFVLLMCAVAYVVLQTVIMRVQGGDSLLRAALGRDRKGKLSLALYLTAIAVTFRSPWGAQMLYAAVAVIWLIPDRRIERALEAQGS